MEPNKRIHIYFTLASHLDLYWMAPPRDALDRGCEIINLAMKLCEKYPEYCYLIESVVFTDYFLRTFPEKKSALKKLLNEGRIEISSCWVDRHDLYNEESIVRHYVHGKRYLKKELDYTPRGVCHSDLPSLIPQIPQICALSEIEFYLRARGQCGVYNWVAPDGSRVLYMNFGKDYIKVRPESLERSLGEARRKVAAGAPEHFLMRGGYIDCALPDDEIFKQMEDFRKNYPDVDFSVTSPDAVADLYLSNPEWRGRLPEISGEWPFGWGSSTACNFHAFKKSVYMENRLLSLEKLTVVCRLLGEKPDAINRRQDWWLMLDRIAHEHNPEYIEQGQELWEAWRAELFRQDHNYSGYGGPKSDTDRNIIFRHLKMFTDQLTASALSGLNKHIDVPEIVNGKKVLWAVPVFNPSAWSRDAAVSLPVSPEGQEQPDMADTFLKTGAVKRVLEWMSTTVDDITPDPLPRLADAPFQLVCPQGNPVSYSCEEGTLKFTARELPACGYKVYYAVECEKPVHPGAWASCVSDSGVLWVETERYRAGFSEREGFIVSLFDKKLERELTGNSGEYRFGEIVAYIEREGRPSVVYGFTGESVSDSVNVRRVCVSHLDSISLSVGVLTEICDSKTIKRFTFYRDLENIDIDVDIKWWGARNRSVRMRFPFTDDGFEAVRYGSMFGHMKWPNMMRGVDESDVLGMGTVNRDEIDSESRSHSREAEKWVDVGFDGFGTTVALCAPKNVWIYDSRIEVSLVRTGNSLGDPHVWIVGEGHHTWRLSILPHKGDWAQANISRFGWEQVTPTLATVLTEPHKGSLPANGFSFFEADAKNVTVTAVKPAYDDPDITIVRFYETEGKSVNAVVSCPGEVTECFEVNLLEHKLGVLKSEENKVFVPVKPYQIKTIAVRTSLPKQTRKGERE